MVKIIKIKNEKRTGMIGMMGMYRMNNNKPARIEIMRGVNGNIFYVNHDNGRVYRNFEVLWNNFHAVRRLEEIEILKRVLEPEELAIIGGVIN